MQRLESSIKNLLLQQDKKALEGFCPYHRKRIASSVSDAKEEVRKLFMNFVDGELDRFKKQLSEEARVIVAGIAEGYVNEVLQLLETQVSNGTTNFTSEDLVNGLVRIFNVEDCPAFQNKK
ncbi:hypothetical protein EI427_01480 [Flammeovirga pectinis]|uniref:Uncharacterized protein n=1 Tax=Flammeovirga pectinis TaxID=2494373 RepID=A0A3S9NY87_9BACT|nr:hypothetical protein [Flammeovirga pectinis]AZQ60930.1 hypothetical protein EI427_01480 [Flammeovirga pectinis]